MAERNREGPWVFTTWTGETVCVDCELAGGEPCEWHRPQSRSHGLMQTLPSDWAAISGVRLYNDWLDIWSLEPSERARLHLSHAYRKYVAGRHGL